MLDVSDVGIDRRKSRCQICTQFVDSVFVTEQPDRAGVILSDVCICNFIPGYPRYFDGAFRTGNAASVRCDGGISVFQIRHSPAVIFRVEDTAYRQTSGKRHAVFKTDLLPRDHSDFAVVSITLDRSDYHLFGGEIDGDPAVLDSGVKIQSAGIDPVDRNIRRTDVIAYPVKHCLCHSPFRRKRIGTY